MFRHPLISFVVFCNLMRSNNNKKLFDDKILFVLIYYDFYTSQIPLVKFGLYICYEGPAFQKLKAGKNEMALPSRYVVNANNAIQIFDW